MTVLTGPTWRAARAAHEDEVDALLGDHLARRAAGTPHPVQDFLFTYYSHRPAKVRTWHPGLGVTLADAEEYLAVAGYEAVAGGVAVGPAAVARRAGTLDFVARLLRATGSRAPVLGCFGMHEWAMVYRGGARHDVALRLGDAGTDAVVERVGLRCTHHDAFRFFTPDAWPRNATAPTREGQVGAEQPGCLHAGMDLDKWCYKLAPLVSSDLQLRALRLAFAARETDMRASPYDLRDWGYQPIEVETPEGRAAYVREQLALTRRASPLRAELLAGCEQALTTTPRVTPASAASPR